MDETIEERLAAVERALTEDDDPAARSHGPATTDRVDDLEADLCELTDRVAELEAATQALRGYVGNVRSVNTEVEQQAEAALSKAERAHRLATENARNGDSGRADPAERDHLDSGDAETTSQSRIEQLGEVTDTAVSGDPVGSPAPPVAGDGGRAIDSDDEEPGLLARISALI